MVPRNISTLSLSHTHTCYNGVLRRNVMGGIGVIHIFQGKVTHCRRQLVSRRLRVLSNRATRLGRRFISSGQVAFKRFASGRGGCTSQRTTLLLSTRFRLANSRVMSRSRKGRIRQGQTRGGQCTGVPLF